MSDLCVGWFKLLPKGMLIMRGVAEKCRSPTKAEVKCTDRVDPIDIRSKLEAGNKSGSCKESECTPSEQSRPSRMIEF